MRLTDLARPTTVSVGEPGRSGNASCLPRGLLLGSTPTGASEDSTIWSGPVAQAPVSSVTASTAPPGSARPTTVSGGRSCPSLSRAAAVTVANGPAAAVTPEAFVDASTCAAVAFSPSTRTDRCAPCWSSKAWSNGAAEAVSSDPPSTAAATAIAVASPITAVCTRRRPTPERTTRPSALIGRSPR